MSRKDFVATIVKISIGAVATGAASFATLVSATGDKLTWSEIALVAMVFYSLGATYVIYNFTKDLNALMDEQRKLVENNSELEERHDALAKQYDKKALAIERLRDVLFVMLAVLDVIINENRANARKENFKAWKEDLNKWLIEIFSRS